MKTFNVGQEVVVLDGASLMGVVVDKAYQNVGGELEPTYKVSIGGSDGRWYNADEVATATPTGAPSAAGAGEREPRTDLDAATLERWPRLIWDRMTKPEFEGFYTDDHGRNDILDLLEVVATLTAELAAARQQVAACLDAMRTLQNAGLSEVIEHYQYRAYVAGIYGDIRETLSPEKLVATVNGLQCIEVALQAASAADGEGG